MKTTLSSTRLFARLVLLSAMLLLMAACGGDEAPPQEALPTEAATVAVEAATEAPPTAEPTAVPPTEEPAAEPTAVETTSDATLSGDCANVYFPVVDGRVYTYSSSISGFGVSNYTQTFSDVTDESFTMTLGFDEGDPIIYTWTCTGEGMLSPEFSQMPAGMEGLSIEFVEATGVTLPSEDMFQPGESWTTHYVAKATIPDTGAGEMTMTETIDLTNTVSGVEAISVPGGDFDEAVRVDTVGTISMVMGDEGTAMSLEMNYTSWYVADVGMVRQEFASLFGAEGANNPSVTELLSFEDQ